MIGGRVSLLLARQYARSPLLVALLLIVPAIFLNLAYVTTKNVDIRVWVIEHGQRVPLAIDQPDVHGAIMVPIVAAFLAGVTGLFVMTDARRSDERLRIAGLSGLGIATIRLTMISVVAVTVALVSVVMTLINFRPENLVGFAAGNVIVSLTYACIGAVVSVVAGRLGGAYLMLVIPFIDLGIFQDPMFSSGDQAVWMKAFPGFGGARFMVDAAFSQRADDWTALGIGLLWLAAAMVVTLWVLRRPHR